MTEPSEPATRSPYLAGRVGQGTKCCDMSHGRPPVESQRCLPSTSSRRACRDIDTRHWALFEAAQPIRLVEDRHREVDTIQLSETVSLCGLVHSVRVRLEGLPL